MKIAYFDCPSGISGNMILGALIDAGLDPVYLRKELSGLRLTAYSLRLKKIKKLGIAGTHLDVKVKEQQRHRGLKDIHSIIKKSKLSRTVKKLSSAIFRRLAEAEAKVHGIPIGKVHFHEVGAVDAIIDIVGACIGIEKLGIKGFIALPSPMAGEELSTPTDFCPTQLRPQRNSSKECRLTARGSKVNW